MTYPIAPQDKDQPIRILIADDHPMLREGVLAVVEMQPDMTVVGEAANGDQAVDSFERLKPDIVLI